MNKLTLDFHQLDALTKMLDLSLAHYASDVKNAKTLVDMCHSQLHYEVILTMYKSVLKFLHEAEKSKPLLHRIQIELTPTQALVFVTSIIPENNLSFYGTVKQIVIDYCIEILKLVNAIPNNPTYRPSENLAPGTKTPFINKSTSINDYLQ